MEVGDAERVLHDRFAIEDGRSAFELLSGLDQCRAFLGPDEPAAGEGARASTVEHELSAIAVLLDLVNPAVAGGRCVD